MHDACRERRKQHADSMGAFPGQGRELCNRNALCLEKREVEVVGCRQPREAGCGLDGTEGELGQEQWQRLELAGSA